MRKSTVTFIKRKATRSAGQSVDFYVGKAPRGAKIDPAEEWTMSRAKKEIPGGESRMGAACWAGFRHRMQKDSTHMMNACEAAPALEYDELLKWLQLCQKAKMIPSYLNPKTMLQKTPAGKWKINMLLKLRTVPDTQTLYIYLSAIRYPREFAHFTRVVLYLMEEEDYDFYLAFGVAHRLLCGGSGHSILPDLSAYMMDIKKAEVDLSFVMAVKEHLHNTKLAGDHRKNLVGKQWHMFDQCRKWARDVTKGIGKAKYTLPLKDIKAKPIEEYFVKG